ncbi:MAG: hypothetical protein V4726_12950 [Verrucomicrobiota bacterium]
MKTTVSLTLLAALALSACDKAEQASAEAKVKEVSAEAKIKTEGAIEKMKAAGAEAAEKTKEASSNVFEKSKILAGQAMEKTRTLTDATADFAKEKLEIPEMDGLNGVLSEAGAALKAGKLKEKADELKAKWNTLYAKAQANAETLAPEARTKVKTFLAKLQARWDAFISSAK